MFFAVKTNAIGTNRGIKRMIYEGRSFAGC
jgi:hypothetical protein